LDIAAIYRARLVDEGLDRRFEQQTSQPTSTPRPRVRSFADLAREHYGLAATTAVIQTSPRGGR